MKTAGTPIWKTVLILLVVLASLLLVLSSTINHHEGNKAVTIDTASERATSQPLKPKTKAELRVEAAAAKKAAVQQALLDEILRQAFAKDTENRMLANGVDCDVLAIGAHHTTLEYKWALASKVTAYQFQNNNSDMWSTMMHEGFKKFVLTDGYDETWTWDLTK
jgi:nucleotide-binding universal stress UspA family protein